jgi:hypothetical protein
MGVVNAIAIAAALTGLVLLSHWFKWRTAPSFAELARQAGSELRLLVAIFVFAALAETATIAAVFVGLAHGWASLQYLWAGFVVCACELWMWYIVTPPDDE